MLSLLWKEIRERSLWAAALCLISVFTTYTRGYTFYGTPGPEMLSWSMGPIFMAFLMGASTYTSELTSRRAVFLQTRPISWKNVLISKLIASAVALLIAAVLAAVMYLVTCPSAYSQYVTASRLADGIKCAVVFTGMAYLVGMSCCGVFAGTAESAAFVLVQGAVLVYLFGLAGARSEKWWQIIQILWPIPMIAAGLVIVRFGLTLPLGERLKRYAFTASAGMVLLVGAVYLTPGSVMNAIIRDKVSQERIDWSISPDGLHALGRDMRNIYWLDIRRDKLITLEDIYEDYSGSRITLEDVGWVMPHTAYRIGYDKDAWFIRTYNWDTGGVKHQDMPMGKLRDRNGYPSEICMSPDGRIAAISLSIGMGLPQTMVFADITTKHKLKYSASRAADTPVWWEQPDEFYFICVHGKVNKIKFLR